VEEFRPAVAVFGLAVVVDVEVMLAGEDCAIGHAVLLKREDLDGCRQGFAAQTEVRVAAEVLLERFRERVQSDGRAALVVIELGVGPEELRHLLNVAAVIGVPEDGVFVQEGGGESIRLVLGVNGKSEQESSNQADTGAESHQILALDRGRYVWDGVVVPCRRGGTGKDGICRSFVRCAGCGIVMVLGSRHSAEGLGFDIWALPGPRGGAEAGVGLQRSQRDQHPC